jgi:ribosomal protein S18 acetylase RimI-like enzyme
MLIRQATPADAETLSTLSIQAFNHAFGHLYPPSDLQAFIAEAYSVAKQAAAIAAPGHAVFLLERDGTAVGYAAVGPCGLPHPDVAAQDGELKRLYLLPEAQNGGWGGRLFDAAIAWLLRDGPRPIWIGVFSENFGAQRFYGRRGWEKVGEYHFAVGDTRDLEYILRRGRSTFPPGMAPVAP